jgi:hypothetical protein
MNRIFYQLSQVLTEKVFFFTNLFTSATSLHAFVSVYFGLVAITFFIVIQIIFKILSIPSTTSEEFLKSQKKIQRKNIFLYRFLHSCVPLKISSGNGTYLNYISSLFLWQFCVDQIKRCRRWK